MHRDENLLFGVFAVQLRKITPGQLAAAAGAWAADPSSDLGGRLVEDRVLSEADRDFVQRLVDEAVRAHEGNAEATLAAVGGREQVYQSFAGSLVVTDSGGIETIAAPAAILDELAGTTVPGVPEAPGRYTTHSEYARGGMGRVLLVHDLHLGRDIALKELLPHLLNHSAQGAEWTPVRKTFPLVARFLQEARITGQLEHPGIVPVYELGHRSDGSVYYTMKLVRGKTLAQAIREAADLQGRIALLPHFVHLCNAIAYAHSRKVIHRDIKPGNIMVGEFGETVVLDWGLAKAKDKVDVHADGFAETLRLLNMGDEAAFAATQYGQALGTPVYMPPEQARGDLNAIDERSDVYSLGAVLFETLAGVVPFDGTSVKEILTQVLTKAPRDIAEFAPDAPAELVTICAKAMAKDPADRYGSAKDLAHDIERFQSGALVGAYSYTPREVMARFVRKHRPIFATASAAIMVLVTATAIFTLHLRQARDLANSQRSLAMEAISTITTELPERFGDIPGTTSVLQEMFVRNAQFIDRLLSADKSYDEEQRLLLSMRLGEGYESLGLLAEASKSYSSSSEFAQRLRERNPFAGQFLFALSQTQLGRVHWKLGRTEDALAACESGHEILIQIKDFTPSSSSVARQLALSKVKSVLGDIYLSQGRTSDAIDMYESSLHIRSNPDLKASHIKLFSDIKLLRDTAFITVGLGQAYEAAGNTVKALSSYKSSLAIIENLKAQNHSSDMAQLAAYDSYFGKGRIYEKSGDTEKCLASYHAALDSAETLARTNPNPGMLLLICSTRNKLGNLYASLHQYSKSLEFQKSALELAVRLAEGSPENLNAQIALSLCYQGLGHTYSIGGYASEYLSSVSKALEISEEVAGHHPNSSEAQQHLGLSYYTLSEAQYTLKDRENALIAVTKSSEILERLANSSRQNIVTQELLHATYFKMGEVFNSLNRPEKALPVLTRALGLSKELSELDPDNVGWQWHLGKNYANEGFTYLALNDYGSASKSLESGRTIMEQIWNGSTFRNPDKSHDLFKTYLWLGTTYSLSGRSSDAISTCEPMLKVPNNLLDIDADDTFAQSMLSVAQMKCGLLYSWSGDHANGVKYLKLVASRMKHGADYSALQVWCILARDVGREQADEYLRLWRDSKGSDDDAQWTFYLIKFLLGELDRESLLMEIDGFQDENKSAARCEALFYIGTKDLIDGDLTSAIENFRESLEYGTPNLFEYSASLIELQRLEITP